MAELVDHHLQRNAVLQRDRKRGAEAVHDAADGRTLLGHRDEHLARASVRVQPDAQVTLVAVDAELVRHALAGVLQSLATRLVDDLLHGLGDDFLGRLLVLRFVALRVQRLRLLAAVAVDRDRLQAQLPTPEICIGDVLRRDVVGHVDRLADRPRQERLGGGHHRHVGLPRDRPDAAGRLERTIEHRQILELQPRGALDRVVLVDVLEHHVDLVGGVTQPVQTETHRLVDDLQHPAAGELFVFHQRDVRLDAGRVAVHHEADRAGRGQHGRLGVAEPVGFTGGQDVVPQLDRGPLQFGGAFVVDVVTRRAVHPHDVHHRFGIVGVSVERTDHGGQFRAGPVGLAVQQRRQRTAITAAGVAVIRQGVGHQDAAQVRITQTQRPEAVAVLGDPVGRVRRVVDENLLGDEERAGRGAEPFDVERPVGADELHQVDRRQVARRVVEEHVLAARVRRVDPAVVRARVPLVDRRVVLDAGVAAIPGTLGHLV